MKIYAKVIFRKQDLPSSDATQIANNLSNLGQIYNREDISTDVKVAEIQDFFFFFFFFFFSVYALELILFDPIRQGVKFWVKMEFECIA